MLHMNDVPVRCKIMKFRESNKESMAVVDNTVVVKVNIIELLVVTEKAAVDLKYVTKVTIW